MNSTTSTRRLSGSSREKLIRILGLLGSDHSGERDAAGLAAHRLVPQHGLAWTDVIGPVPTPSYEQHRPAPEPQPEPVGWRRTVAQCLARRWMLDNWQYQFLQSVGSFRVSVQNSNAAWTASPRLFSEAAMTEPTTYSGAEAADVRMVAAVRHHLAMLDGRDPG